MSDRGLASSGRGMKVESRALTHGVDIPSSGDLQARFDATELTASDGDTVSTWPDETGNGFDLTAGTAATYKTSIINGNPVVRFDGADDYLTASYGSNLSQPITTYLVMVKQSSGGPDYAIDGSSANTHTLYENNGNFNVYAGNTPINTAADTNSHIHGVVADGASSVYRLDGSQVDSGDIGSNSMGGVSVGVRGDIKNYGDWDIGEILIYQNDKSSKTGDIETYLSNKWGISI